MDELFNADYLVLSPSYGDVMNSMVLPWLEERADTRMVSTYDGHSLFCQAWQAESPSATVVIVHGFTENALKYSELIWSLLHLGFSVIAYDQRGHGRSWRADGIPDPSVTHVDHFSDYVRDLHTVCDSFRNSMPAPWFLFAHSMGGAVASLFLEQEPDIFRAAVLSSPMIAPSTRGIPVFLASALSFAAVSAGRGKRNPFFMHPYAGPEDFGTSCATDPERFAWYDRIKASDTAFQNSIPSYRWSSESLRVTGQILAPGRPEKISCPVLLFSAGTDFSVLPGPQKQFTERLRSGRFIPVPLARHEIYRSVNDVLFPWWHDVICFFNTNLSLQIPEGGIQS
ncbi:MAG: alpha/beta hydrolase [Clostridia bacterium]|nr:alpha/beta hydrolase [Clostridia bacterium]